MRAIALVQAVLVCALLACGPERSATPADAGDHEPGASASAATVPVERTPDAEPDVELVAEGEGTPPKKAARHPGERPLPAFSGTTLAGTRLSISSMIGRRMLLFFFNPETEPAGKVADAVVQIAKQAQSHNFRVVGVGIGSDRSHVREFSTAHGVDFPVIDDSNGHITSLLGLPGPILLLGADAEGYVTFVLQGFDTTAPDAEQVIADRLREALRIPAPPHGGKLVQHPKAPTFRTEDIDGKPFDLAALDGKPKIVMFFLHTCPHCHKALAFLEKALAEMPEAKRPALVAISVQNRPSAVRIALSEAGLDFFTPLLDPGGEIAEKYGLASGVPDIALVDAAGEIVYRMQGWRDDRDPALVKMYLSRIAGEKIPMLLSRNGYTGNDACTVCHEQEAAAWAITPHARAYDTLVTHGKERDGECVSCHVVGYGKPGGYSFERPAQWLEGVGCEDCHGRGGPHLSPEYAGRTDYSGVCVTCHDTKHSLGFDYATFLPGISHKAIEALTDEQRLARFETPLSHRELLPSGAAYVGSDACQRCHEAEFATWAKSPHAHAIDSLKSGGKAGEADCLKCHTTAWGREGGFPKSGAADAHPDLARVGCESCHGPGGDHVGPDARRVGTIVSLGDKCDSCVILQICGSCHDSANDADFEFSVQEHIDRQRHGTIEPGTGKPLGGSAALEVAPTDTVRIARAIRWLEDVPVGGR